MLELTYTLRSTENSRDNTDVLLVDITSISTGKCQLLNCVIRVIFTSLRNYN